MVAGALQLQRHYGRMAHRSGIYIVPTDRWYIERTVWLISGVFLIASTALAALHDARWIVFVIITGLASINVALNGFCIVGNVLTRLGFKGLLATDPSVARRPAASSRLAARSSAAWLVGLVVAFTVEFLSVVPGGQGSMSPRRIA